MAELLSAGNFYYSMQHTAMTRPNEMVRLLALLAELTGLSFLDQLIGKKVDASLLDGASLEYLKALVEVQEFYEGLFHDGTSEIIIVFLRQLIAAHGVCSCW